MTLRLATRSSPLALEQARRVRERLLAVGAEDVEVVRVDSDGDRRRDVAISELGGRGAFTNAIEQAVLEGRAEVAVHSAKDLPAATDSGALVLAAVPERADARDVLVGAALAELSPGALVLTGAPRRRAQLAYLRPDLSFGELRGNIETRLARASASSAVVVALAGLERLDLHPDVTEVLSMRTMLPMVGQGALALRCGAEDEQTRELLALIDEESLHRALDAERGFLSALGGGCRAPLGAFAEVFEAGGPIHLAAMIASPEGRLVLRREAIGEEPASLGAGIAATLLEQDGASALLGSFS